MLILIAVALFAVLSYVVTKGSRSGAPAMREKGILSAATILDFTSQIRVAVQRLKVLNGVPITDLKFNNDVYRLGDGSLVFGAMGNPSDPRRYVFHARGGGVPPRTFEDLATPCPLCNAGVTTTPGHINMQWTNIPGLGTSTSDPAVFVLSLKKDVCAALNERLGIAGIPAISSNYHSNYPGSPYFPYLPTITDADAGKVTGKSEFCYWEPSINRYVFVSVIEQN